MKIVREKSTNEVVYKGDDLVLDNIMGLYGKNFRANNITNKDYELLDVDNIPNDFIGRHYIYADNIWVETETKIQYDIEEYKKSIPIQVTMRQARLALLNAGLLDDVEAAINNIENESIRRLIQIEWEYAIDIRRDWEALQIISQIMNISEEQLDELFLMASRL
jgi:hypothetical protein